MRGHSTSIRRLVVAVGIAASLLPAASGEAPYRDAEPPLHRALSSALRWQRFTVEDGLPSMRVHQVIETPAGTPWVVTGAGIAWFDGYQWHDTREAGRAMERPPVIAPADRDRVLIVHDGDLLFGDRSGLTPYEIADRALRVISAAVTPDGMILAIARRAGGGPELYRLDGGVASPIRTPALAGHPESGFVRVTRSGRVWIGARDGLYRREGGGWIGPVGGWATGAGSPRIVVENERGQGLVTLRASNPVSTASEWDADPDHARTTERLGDRKVIAADVGPTGDAVIAVESSVVRARVDGVWHIATVHARRLSVTALRFRQNGDLWLGTPNGLHLLHRKPTWSRWTIGKWGPQNRVNAVLSTRDGALWMGTMVGAAVARPDGTETRFEEVDGIALGTVTGLAEDDEGGVWVTSGSSFAGAFRYHDGEWCHRGAADGLDAPYVHAVRRDRSGRLWFLGLGDPGAGNDPGAFVWDGAQFERWDVARGLIGNRVYAFAEAADGTRWFGTGSGLSRWREGTWTHWTRREGLRVPRVFTLALDGDDRPWVGHQWDGHGLAHIDDQDRVVYADDPSDLAYENVYDIAADEHGALWLATEGGVYVVHDGAPTWVGNGIRWERGRILTVLPDGDMLHLGTGAQGVVSRRLGTRSDDLPARISVHPVAVLGRTAHVRWTVHGHEAAWPQVRQSRVRIDDDPWSAWTDRNELLVADVDLATHRVTVESRDVLGRMATVRSEATFEIPVPLYRQAAFVAPLAAVLALLLGATLVLFVRRQRSERALRRKTTQLTTVTDAMTHYLSRGTLERPSVGLLKSALEHTDRGIGFMGVLDDHGCLLVLVEQNMRWEPLAHGISSSDGAVIVHHPDEAFGAPDGPYITIPIRRGDETVGLLGFSREERAELGADERGWLDTICRTAGLLYDGYRRRQREIELTDELRRRSELERLLFRELDHRVRNHLASLISLIELTRRQETDVPSFAASIHRRIDVMARVHTLLSQEEWKSVSMRSIVETLNPPDCAGSLDMQGPPVLVSPRQATALAMVTHELITNSLKYGALGAPSGQVQLTWTVDADMRMSWTWTETGGPPVVDTPVPGTGLGLIEGFTRSELRGTATLAFDRGGARHGFSFQLDVSDHEVDDARAGADSNELVTIS